ncbi:MAG TPA: hypothetical protein VF316_03800 [Polyangiaceae bacterium]
MRKIIGEIMSLLWKLLVRVFWVWLKPILGRIVMIVLMVIAVLTMLIALLRC